jgi:hypothetical protein
MVIINLSFQDQETLFSLISSIIYRFLGARFIEIFHLKAENNRSNVSKHLEIVPFSIHPKVENIIEHFNYAYFIK